MWPSRSHVAPRRPSAVKSSTGVPSALMVGDDFGPSRERRTRSCTRASCRPSVVDRRGGAPVHVAAAHAGRLPAELRRPVGEGDAALAEPQELALAGGGGPLGGWAAKAAASSTVGPPERRPRRPAATAAAPATARLRRTSVAGRAGARAARGRARAARAAPAARSTSAAAPRISVTARRCSASAAASPGSPATCSSSSACAPSSAFRRPAPRIPPSGDRRMAPRVTRSSSLGRSAPVGIPQRTRYRPWPGCTESRAPAAMRPIGA